MAKDFEVIRRGRGLKSVMRSHPERLDDALDTAALEGKRIVQMSFNTSPAGRTHKRGGKIHVASIAGMPPNIDMGKLMNAIYTYTPKRFSRAISTGDTEYAVYLEFGTSRMAARPFMRPMAAKMRKLLPQLLKNVAQP
jgi:HK97 gp10 family phage protein